MAKISVNNFNKPVFELIDADRNFIELITNKITAYGQIPYSVPEKLIIGIIKESALYFFRMAYFRSQQTLFYRLDKKQIIEFIEHEKCSGEKCETYPKCNHEKHHIHPSDYSELPNNPTDNIRGYVVKLPAFVNVVSEIYQTNRDINSGVPDHGDEMDYSQEIFWNTGGANGYGRSMMGINSILYTIERVARIQQATAWNATMGTSVPFSYNNATKHLMIFKTFNSDFKSLMLKCDCNVDIQVLYEDDLFIKYVYARCKQELRRMVGSHTIQLPGDVTLNVDELCYRCDDEVQEVQETLKGSSGIGDVILQR